MIEVTGGGIAVTTNAAGCIHRGVVRGTMTMATAVGLETHAATPRRPGAGGRVDGVKTMMTIAAGVPIEMTKDASRVGEAVRGTMMTEAVHTGNGMRKGGLP